MVPTKWLLPLLVGLASLVDPDPETNIHPLPLKINGVGR